MDATQPRKARSQIADGLHLQTRANTGAQTFAFSRFNSKTDNNPKPETRDWRGVIELLKERKLKNVDLTGIDLSTSDADRIERAKNGPAFSGAFYPTGATRGNENVSGVSLLILDFDNGTPLEEIEAGVASLNNGAGAAAAIYSTFRHTPEKPKFRLALPLASSVEKEQFLSLWKRGARHFKDAPDKAPKDAARLQFLPSCPKARAGDAVFVSLDGAPLDVATLPVLPQPEAEPARTPSAPVASNDGTRDRYPLGALKGEAGRVASAANGTRNETLNKAALKLGKYIGAGRLDRGEVEAALMSAATSAGLPENEARATIQSGIGKGETEPNFEKMPADVSAPDFRATVRGIKTPDENGAPLEIPAPSMRNERGALEYEPGQLVEILRPGWTCAALSTEAAHATRILEHIGGDLRFCPSLGWLTFNGRHWQRDDRHATQTADKAKEVSQVIRSEAATLYELAGELARDGRESHAEAMGKAAAAHTKHAPKVEAKSFVGGALHFAAGSSQVRVSPDAFDQRPWLLGFQNGVWDAGNWREHRRDDLLLHLCPGDYIGDADRREWERVLKAITGGDADFARTLQDAAGYILSGASHLRFLPWLYGPKGTGKSTFAELLQTILGRMAGTIDPKKLQDDSARERLGADLWNRRLAVCAEAGSQKLEAELLKTLSGADTLTVRFLYQEAFDALPRHVLLMVSNDAPRLNAYDDALKDRVVALPFVHRLDADGPLELTGGARIEAVRKDINSPLVRGFTAWALEGLARVHQTQSIFRAPCIEAATAKFWSDTDPLTPFWETVDADELRGGVSKTELRRQYEVWCLAEGARPFNRNQWALACKSFGLEDERRTGGTWFWFFVEKGVTQVTQLRSFPETSIENLEPSRGLLGKEASCVTCVTPTENEKSAAHTGDDERETGEL